MGQQQLLLIILGTIVVGIAVAIAVAMFSDNSESSTRDAMSTDLLHLAAKARHYYGRPTSMGGGGKSFDGISMDKLVTNEFANNPNGRYFIYGTPTSTLVVFRGVGKITTTSGDSIEMELSVGPNGPGNITKIQ